jgi:hypothetical protein
VKEGLGVTNQHCVKIGSRSADGALEQSISAVEDLAHYAQTRQLTEANNLLIELLSAIFAAKKAPRG